jgi:ATP-dependent helicase/nuclease subunit A
VITGTATDYDLANKARLEALERAARKSVLSATALAERAAKTETADHAGLATGSCGASPGYPRRVLDGRRHDSDKGRHSREAALSIGRAVHQAIASLDLATGLDAMTGATMEEVARRWSEVNGIPEHASVVARMLANALASPTVRLAATRRHWKEMPVTAVITPDASEVGRGQHPSAGRQLGSPVLLEGVLDLLIDDEDGVVVVDFKTDYRSGPPSPSSPGPSEGLPAATHRIQLAAYALTVERATGLRVKQALAIQLAGDEPVEMPVEDLHDAMEEVANICSAQEIPSDCR